jgi:methyl-accepting chemotaxis protein
MWLNDISIPRKLSLAFGLILLSVAVSSGILFNAAHNRDTAAEIARAANRQEVAALNAMVAHIDMAQTMRGYLLTSVERHKRLYGEAVGKFAESIRKAISPELSSMNPKSADALGKFQHASNQWRTEIAEPIMKMAGNADTREQALAIAMSPRSSELQQIFRDAQLAAFETIRIWAEATAVIEDSAALTADISVIAGGVAALIIALICSMVLSRNVAAPIRRLTTMMADMARGQTSLAFPGVERKDCVGLIAIACESFRADLIQNARLQSEAETQRRNAEEERTRSDAERELESHRLHDALAAFAEGLGKLAQGDVVHRIDKVLEGPAEKLRIEYNETMAQLQDTLITVIRSAQTIDGGSREITATADDMSRRTEQQAANLEETAAALEQITSTVKRTAEGATHAREAVATATLDAEKGGAIVRQAITAMDNIEKSSGQIGQIIGVIDEIAFQTNLLALNAGVEAARAGDAGRGFAVVASEVRALAQRSAEAAKEIKALISASTTQVNQGVSLVSETGTALDRIVSQVAGIKSIVSEIAAGASEQATGLQEINNAINQMDQITQQNAAMVEESTASSHTLAKEAQKLNSYVARFQTGERESAPSRVVALADKPRRAKRPLIERTPAERPQERRKVANGGYEQPARSSASADSWEEF